LHLSSVKSYKSKEIQLIWQRRYATIFLHKSAFAQK